MQAVASLLEQTLLDDNRKRDAAEKKLLSLQSKPAFLITLLHICGSPQSSRSLSLSAAILVKNCIKDFFIRRTRLTTEFQEQKAQLENELIKVFKEAPTLQPKVEELLATAVGFASRFQWPTGEWKTLFPSIGNILQSQKNPRRGLVLLEAVLDNLSTVFLSEPRQKLTKVCQNILTKLEDTWTHQCNLLVQMMRSFLESKGSPEERNLEKLAQLVNLLTSCIRMLMLNGNMQPYPFSPQQKKIFPKLLQMLKIFPEFHQRFQSYPELQSCLSKICLSLAKTVVKLAELHHVAFVSVARLFIPYTLQVLKTSINGVKPAFEDFTIMILRFLLTMYKSPHYLPGAKPRLPRGVDAKKLFDRKEAQAVYEIQIKILKPLVETTVTKLLPLTEDDIQQWDSDPEQYFYSTDRMHKFEALRPTAEAFIYDLIKFRQKEVQPILHDLLRHTMKMPAFELKEITPNTIKQALIKDALYYAIGISSTELDQVLSDSLITRWYAQVWSKEAADFKHTKGHFIVRVLQRRIIYLLGQFPYKVHKMPTECRVSVYKGLFSLLRKGGDIVIRLSALHSLKELIGTLPEEGDFQKHFADVIPELCGLTIQLALDCEETQSKRQVLAMLQYIFAQTGPSIAKSIPVVLRYLPSLWRNCENHNIVRNSILFSLRVLIETCKNHTTWEAVKGVADILKWCMDPKEFKTRDYLHVASLDLWVSTIQFTQALSKPLFYNMFEQYWPGVLQLGSNNGEFEEFDVQFIETWLSVAHLYAIKSPPSFVECSKVLAPCIHRFANMISKDRMPHRKLQCFKQLDSMLSDFTRISPKQFLPKYHVVVKLVLEDILKPEDSRDGSGRRHMMRFGTMRHELKSNHFHVVARVICTPGIPASELFDMITDKKPLTLLNPLLETFEKVIHPSNDIALVKLNAVALCHFMKIKNRAFVEQHLKRIVTAAHATVIREVKYQAREAKQQRSKRPSIQSYSLYKDPFESIQMKVALRKSLEDAARIHQNFRQMLQKCVDRELLQNLGL
eukprot:CAMPEP_0167751032 /NCGR_PEP_ID=MMETSP0110_2-20121227/6329_1 /TAXON_ID=629695 /ORGANISM="Gymnochlora sp., Strain CCMP2014" /LENGTH=1016 /DNA_ID=CAMNT_0007636435 /DNA_START=57 /DNA_END=3107 /DNA_ORIENTATION=+